MNHKSISQRNLSINRQKTIYSKKLKKKPQKKSDWYNNLMKKLDTQIKDLKKLIKK
jgi:hypothetical protein